MNNQEIKDEVVSIGQYMKLRQNLYWYIAVSCTIAIGALFFALWAKDTHDRTATDLSITKANLDSVSKLAIHYMNKDSLEVVENISLKAQNEGSIKDLSDKVFNLNSRQQKLIATVTHYTQVKQKVDLSFIKTLFDTGQKIPLIAKGRSDSIGVPNKFSLSDSTFEVSGIVAKTGVQISHLSFTNELFMRQVTRKKGFLNMGREDIVQAYNSSIYVRNTGIADLTLHKRTNAWNRWIKPVLSAGVGGTIVYYIRK